HISAMIVACLLPVARVSFSHSVSQSAPPLSTLFPYTTLFRSAERQEEDGGRARRGLRAKARPVSRHVVVGEDPGRPRRAATPDRSEEHTSELQSPDHLVCRLLLQQKNKSRVNATSIKVFANAQ